MNNPGRVNVKPMVDPIGIIDETARKVRDSIIHRGVIEAFHALSFYSPGMSSPTWMGIPCSQNPLDMWVTQEIIWETKPDFIIETGTWFGGSALYYACCSAATIISIDTQTSTQPMTQRIEETIGKGRIIFIKGNSTDPYIVASIASMINGKKAMVILDSDHSSSHVSAELKAYAPLVSSDCYMIVQDTNIAGNPVFHEQWLFDGPADAVREFLATNKSFEQDSCREKFILTFFPGGWLKRRQEHKTAQG